MKRLALLVAAFSLAGPACGSDKSNSNSSDTTTAPKLDQVAAPPASGGPTGPASEDGPQPGQVVANPDGHNFIAEARFLYKVAACGSLDMKLPESLSERTVDQACKRQRKALELYRKKWLDRARPFFDEVVPDSLPATVVYPFGGGDLMTGMAVFPEFAELTTLSLEPAGDPRGVTAMPAAKFNKALAVIHRELRRLYRINHSLTKEMITNFRGGSLPGHLIFSLAALDIHGMVPTGVYYFELRDDGSVDYLTTAEIEELSTSGSKKKRNAIFGNVEIRFSKPGDSRVRVYRHLMANLDNEHIAADPSALRHLEAKGKVAMMTKAASFLLWWDNFSTIRKYVLDHAAWMVSDATGVPPEFAAPAGFVQETWGRFTGPILSPGKAHANAFRKLWKENPSRKLAFRFGYPDKRGLNHLMITRPAK